MTLRATEQPIDTGTAAGKAFLDMLGVFAEFETNLRKERQLEGIAKAKAAGVYKGRVPSVDTARVRQLQAEGLKPLEIAGQARHRPSERLSRPQGSGNASLIDGAPKGGRQPALNHPRPWYPDPPSASSAEGSGEASREQASPRHLKPVATPRSFDHRRRCPPFLHRHGDRLALPVASTGTCRATATQEVMHPSPATSSGSDRQQEERRDRDL